MYNKPHVTAVIVARKGSVRILNKNYQKIGDDTLIERKIKQLKKSRLIDRIVVGSDDDSLLDVAQKHNVDFFRRPNEYCDEISRTPNDMVKNMLSFFDGEYVIWCHVTNPLIHEQLYDDAITKFFDEREKKGADSLFSAIEMRGHFWNHLEDKLKTVNFEHHSPIHKVAKELPPIYAQNGGIFIRDHVSMSIDGHFIGKKPAVFLMDKVVGIDIDYLEDLEMARLFHSSR